MREAESQSGGDRVGAFRYLAGDDRWFWADAVARMHGYAPGTVEPTAELVLSHRHPQDDAGGLEAVGRVLGPRSAFSSRYRILDAQGVERVLVVVGDCLRDDDGTVIGTAGFFIDVTDTFDAAMQKSVTEVVAGVEERRAVINQAIGVIRVCYGVSAERAFEVLTWRSQQTNVKLRVIAAQVVDELAEQSLGSGARDHVDHVLLTAHERVVR